MALHILHLSSPRLGFTIRISKEIFTQRPVRLVPQKCNNIWCGKRWKLLNCKLWNTPAGSYFICSSILDTYPTEKKNAHILWPPPNFPRGVWLPTWSNSSALAASSKLRRTSSKFRTSESPPARKWRGGPERWNRWCATCWNIIEMWSGYVLLRSFSDWETRIATCGEMLTMVYDLSKGMMVALFT